MIRTIGEALGAALIEFGWTYETDSCCYTIGKGTSHYNAFTSEGLDGIPSFEAAKTIFTSEVVRHAESLYGTRPPPAGQTLNTHMCCPKCRRVVHTQVMHSPCNTVGPAWDSVAFTNGVFVAIMAKSPNEIQRSTDYGASWSCVPTPSCAGFQNVECIRDTFEITTKSGRKFRSLDLGSTWFDTGTNGAVKFCENCDNNPITTEILGTKLCESCAERAQDELFG